MGIDFVDEYWMRQAISLARRAEKQGEVPVGAVMVATGKRVGEGWNSPIQLHDATAHAEIMAIRAAGRRLENYRLIHTTLYVTLEPCVMCMGAIANARVERLVFGAYDGKRGAVCNALDLADAEFLNHKVVWRGGVLEARCAGMLTDFFRARR